MRLAVVKVDPGLRQSLATGHPWVYRNQVGDAPNYETGTWVEVRAGTFSAIGLWDDEGAIAIRIFSRILLPDARWLRARVREAWAARAPLRERETTAYRWLYGENEGVPGITVDIYGPFAVIRTYAHSVERLVQPLAEGLRAEAPLEGIVWRRHRVQADQEVVNEHAGEEVGKVQLVWGKLPPPDLVIREHGLQFQANLLVGQKTGLFLDHRENRRWLQDWSRGKTMLNCFAYTGAFSLYAIRGGATSVTSCDIAPAAADEFRANLALNGFAGEHPFVVADCFDLLADYAKQRRTFDIVVIDPPSFAHSRRQAPAALRAYSKLNTHGIQCVAPGGLLASASCTSQVSPDEFRGMLVGAAQAAGKRLVIIHEAAQPLDHPVAAHFPEGRYLKFVVARVLPTL